MALSLSGRGGAGLLHNVKKRMYVTHTAKSKRIEFVHEFLVRLYELYRIIYFDFCIISICSRSTFYVFAVFTLMTLILYSIYHLIFQRTHDWTEICTRILTSAHTKCAEEQEEAAAAKKFRKKRDTANERAVKFVVGNIPARVEIKRTHCSRAPI